MIRSIPFDTFEETKRKDVYKVEIEGDLNDADCVTTTTFIDKNEFEDLVSYVAAFVIDNIGVHVEDKYNCDTASWNHLWICKKGTDNYTAPVAEYLNIPQDYFRIAHTIRDIKITFVDADGSEYPIYLPSIAEKRKYDFKYDDNY